MSTTYNFVKVAAGEPFPFESGYYFYTETPESLSDEIDGMEYLDNGEKKLWHYYILRPVEPAADGGREAIRDRINIAIRKHFEDYDPDISIEGLYERVTETVDKTIDDFHGLPVNDLQAALREIMFLRTGESEGFNKARNIAEAALINGPTYLTV